jgi:SHS2 domain-containing protein
MSEAGYEFFDHTADIGIRAHGRAVDELLINFSRGLVELLVEGSVLQAREERRIELTADDIELLTLAWLKELLFWFSAHHFVPVQYRLTEATQTAVRGTIRGETFDPSRHLQGREVKAITRHALDVRQQDGMWCGQVIVDI